MAAAIVRFLSLLVIPGLICSIKRLKFPEIQTSCCVLRRQLLYLHTGYFHGDQLILKTRWINNLQ